MIVLFLVLSILVAVVGFVIANVIENNELKYNTWYSVSITAGVFGSFFSIISIVMFCFLADDVISEKTIEKKIVAYEENNEEIETQIGTLVQNYMEYEKDTFSSIKNEDYISLVSLYPELKSDELVQSQMSLYLDNNKKILKLKEQKIDIAKSKWWLYFGK